MPADSSFRTVEQQKRRWITSIAISLGIIATSAILRFVPTLDDAISGPPAYMAAFAKITASQIADVLHNQYPVFAVRDEDLKCGGMSEKENAADSDDSLYVLTFAERSRSLCLTIYGIASDRSTGAITIGSAVGRNYGRPLTAPVKAVALQRNLTTLTPAYISLFHWRTKLSLSGNIAAAKTERLPSRSADISFADISVNLLDLRAETAKRHNVINNSLLGTILVGCLVFLYSASMLHRLYRTCQQYCRAHESDLQLREFMRRDVAAIADESQRNYSERQREMHTQAHVKHIAQLERESIRHGLTAILERIGDQTIRKSIQEALENNELPAMQSLLDQLSAQAAQKTPADRLTLLLESLREYCTNEQYARCQAEAFDLLSRTGFRDARDLVVARHDEFRNLIRAMQEKQGDFGTAQTSQSRIG